MRVVFARGKQSTKPDLSAPLTINNCGYYENQKLPPKMVRPKGRMDYHLILIDKGTMFFSLNQKMLKLTKNDFLIYAPNTPQLYFFEQDTLYNFYWIHFSGYYIRELLSLCKLDQNYSSAFFYRSYDACLRNCKNV